MIYFEGFWTWIRGHGLHRLTLNRCFITTTSMLDSILNTWWPWMATGVKQP